MERAYIGDRFTWTSLGFDGLNGRAEFPKSTTAAQGGRKYFAQHLKPWQSRPARLAVIMGQVRGDASLGGLSIVDWARFTAIKLAGAGFTAVFRPHPGDRGGKIEVPGVQKPRFDFRRSPRQSGARRDVQLEQRR